MVLRQVKTFEFRFLFIGAFSPSRMHVTYLRKELPLQFPLNRVAEISSPTHMPRGRHCHKPWSEGIAKAMKASTSPSRSISPGSNHVPCRLELTLRRFREQAISLFAIVDIFSNIEAPSDDEIGKGWDVQQCFIGAASFF
jgi:hypothetical protein